MSPPKPAALRDGAIIACAFAVACSRGEPPSLVSAESAATSPLPPPTHPLFSASAAPSVAPPPVDPGTLAQTHDEPEASSASLDARGEALFEAIQNDDPERAMSAFFPRAAYEQVKAITNPASDWKYRLVANFKRDIHTAHFALGRKSTDAKYVSLEPGSAPRWVEPGEEGNKLGYFRVYGTKLHYSIDGQPRAIDVTSLISWRGEWYVVHLAGFS